ncbi:MAG: Ribonuclease HII [Parcubacteria group bacterium GW2011_GWC1_42_11]|nr:MAG: Ribonuclease HII [Parcubacteria group bacterium GW2011_GWC1_42_11]KKT08280.1 MAG: Ribonuclease HII [Candidatus Nomurabacteria bacterium GW2011_GWB1_43_20]
MNKRTGKYEHIIGIDEVGRGPLAGPVAVGAVCIYAEHHKRVTKLFPVIKDSKKLTAKLRDEWNKRIFEAESLGYLSCAVAFVPPSVIDKKGLSHAIRSALTRALKIVDPVSIPNSKFNIQYSTLVLLDGGLRAPSHYLYQETIIKGDEKELSIALASIVAKVARDKKMVALAKKFPEHGFEKHKGYGTHAHYEAIKKHGITPHHRKSFLKGLL